MALIRYFINHRHLNHLMLVLLFLSGVYAYIKIPKEMFPELNLDSIVVMGSYPGASAKTLEQVVVREIEDQISAVSGIKESESVIAPGNFQIILKLADGQDQSMVLDQVKDAVAMSRPSFPLDMDEPITKIMIHSKDLIHLSIASNSVEFGELVRVSDAVKTQVSQLEHVSEVLMQGASDEQIEITLNAKAIIALGLDPLKVSAAINQLSYTFPVGAIDNAQEYYYVSMAKGKANAQSWAESILKIDEKKVRLGSIATVTVGYPNDLTRSFFNGQKQILLRISKDETGNAISLVKTIKVLVEDLNKEHSNIKFELCNDSAKPLKERLDIIIANLFLGLILVFFTMRYLISLRTAIVVSLGVPFSFIIGLLFIYYSGYSLNLVSLIGALITIGIVVDDAIVVSENIQRHLDEGMEHSQAVIQGVKEMLMPVTIATATTVIAFLPMLTLSAEIGRFIFLIPIAVILILLGSLLESFLFLPLHAKELLHPKEPHFDWKPLILFYQKSLAFFIQRQRQFMVIFIVVMPLITVLLFTSMRFQFFPRFDGQSIYISGKLNVNANLDQTQDYVLALESEVMKQQKAYGIKSVSTIAGWRRNLQADRETGENLFFIEFELFDRIDENWINRYISPILSFSFDFSNPEKIREQSALEISQMMHKELKAYVIKHPLEEIGVTANRVGLLRSDIKINLSSSDDQKLEKAVALLESKLHAIEGVKDIGDNIKYGKKEIVLLPNAYAESLGMNEQTIALLLNRYYLGNAQSKSMGGKGIIEIVTKDLFQADLESFKAFELPLGDGTYARLDSLCEFNLTQDYEKIEKNNGSIIKTVFANVDVKRITANEVLADLKETLETFKSEGIEIILKGEAEKNRQFSSEISFAIIVALVGILAVLMLVFPRIKYALMILSVIPFSVFGALLGHIIMDMNLTMPSIVGILGLSGVVVNDGIIMLSFLNRTHDRDELYRLASLRLRPILITTITTFVGLATLMFYATGQAVILQPIAVSLGFGLIWGTLLNLYYLPTLYALINKIKH